LAKRKLNIVGQRVNEQAVANILNCIAILPNYREERQTDDLNGDYTYWFDHGACKIMRGGKRFVFKDGTKADLAELPLLSLTINFPDGRVVVVQQESW
jgi:hypothetical protein